jgi:glutamate synthase domain-containing protein 1
MVFFNQDPIKAEAARNNMNREILAAGLQLVGWRKVPIDTSVYWVAWRWSVCRRSSKCSSPVTA